MRYLHAPLHQLPAAGRAPAGSGPLAAWAAAVRGASEACVLLAADASVVAASSAFGEVAGVPLPELAGPSLFGGVLEVLDFGAGHPVSADELARIPPLLALSADALARSLLRVRRPDGSCLTVDAISSPVHGRPDGGVQGSVTFVRVV